MQLMDRVQTPNPVWMARPCNPQFTKKICKWSPHCSDSSTLYTQRVKNLVRSTQKCFNTQAPALHPCGHYSDSQLSPNNERQLPPRGIPLFLFSLHSNPPSMLPHFPSNKNIPGQALVLCINFCWLPMAKAWSPDSPATTLPHPRPLHFPPGL